MFRQFELFEKMPTSRNSTTIRVSLNVRGSLAINKKAYESLGSPESVELYFDKNNGLIGIKACSPELKHAYPVKKQGKSSSWLIRGRAFCNFYNIRIPATMAFEDVEIEDDMLILDLHKVSEVAPRVAKKKKEDRQMFVLGGGR